MKLPKNHLLTIFLLFFALMTGCSSDTSQKGEIAKAKQENPPNIIFIMADDLGYADLGCYGQEVILTPNLDQMAKEGMKFTDCYAGSPVCAPSRSVLMSGLHTGHTRVRGNMSRIGGTPPQGRVPLNLEDLTVAEVLKQAGYVTGITGKWGLGEPETSGVPTKQGFDQWFGYLNQRNAHSYYPPYLWKNEEKVILEGNQDGGEGQYTHDMFTEFALDFIESNADTNFFLYLPYTVPHAKYEIPDLGPYAEKDWEENAKVHAAMVTRLDGDVGKIFSLLKKMDIDENTLVFFCSDNGAAQRWEGRFDSSGPLKGFKRSMYDGGIRTPMLVRYPNVVEAGAISGLPWYFADVMPTLAEIAGLPKPSDIDGRSVWPTILGEQQDFSERYMYWEFYEKGFNQAARKGKWKAVRLGVDEPVELYNLEEDIDESENLAEQYPDIAQDFAQYLQQSHIESPLWPSGLGQ